MGYYAVKSVCALRAQYGQIYEKKHKLGSEIAHIFKDAAIGRFVAGGKKNTKCFVLL